MFPFYESQNPMDTPLYQQLQLSPPSPKPDQAFYYPYPSPPFAAEGFHLNYLAAAPTIAIDIPPPPPEQLAIGEVMTAMKEQPPQKADAIGAGVAGERATTKDRHSKICTAGGMRDRRMRLSLEVARKFFALQDMLGFDKASKTVQWLLNKSKAAIKELMSTSPSSECEDGSSLSDNKHKPMETGEKANNEGKRPKVKRAAPKTPRKSNAHPVPDKETRAKARERARERTREKNRLRWVTLASSIAIEAVGDESSSHNLNHSSKNMVSEVEERCSSSLNNEPLHGRMQEICMATEPSDTIRAFEYGNNVVGSGNTAYNYQEQWDLGGVVFANAWPRY